RAPRPAVRVQLAQRLGVAVAAQRFGDAAQVGGKHEAFYSRHRALQRIEELQQKAAVEVHRAGDVAERHDARLARLAAAAAQVDQLAGGGTAQRAAQIHARAARRRLPSPARARREPPCDAPGDALDLLQLAGIEGAEVLLGAAWKVAGTGDFFRLLGAFALRRPTPQ